MHIIIKSCIIVTHLDKIHDFSPHEVRTYLLWKRTVISTKVTSCKNCILFSKSQFKARINWPLPVFKNKRQTFQRWSQPSNLPIKFRKSSRGMKSPLQRHQSFPWWLKTGHKCPLQADQKTQGTAPWPKSRCSDAAEAQTPERRRSLYRRHHAESGRLWWPLRLDHQGEGVRRETALLPVSCWCHRGWQVRGVCPSNEGNVWSRRAHAPVHMTTGHSKECKFSAPSQSLPPLKWFPFQPCSELWPSHPSPTSPAHQRHHIMNRGHGWWQQDDSSTSSGCYEEHNCLFLKYREFSSLLRKPSTCNRLPGPW